MVIRSRNPAWVDKALRDNWAKLQAMVGEKWMPISWTDDTERGPGEYAGARGDKFQEYGTGHYGTVLRLRDPHVVLKITSDPAEAQFVALATQIGSFPDGLVRYFRIVELPGSFRGRSTFAIWREAAHDVGLFIHTGHHGADKVATLLHSDRRSIQESAKYLLFFKNAAHEVRLWLNKNPGKAEQLRQVADNIDYDDTSEYITDGKVSARFRGVRKIALYYSALDGLTEMMENTNGLHYVGGALRFYLERGVLLADVHAGNVGLVDRPGHNGPMAVITDPGHAIFLKPQQYAAPSRVANRGRRQ